MPENVTTISSKTPGAGKLVDVKLQGKVLSSRLVWTRTKPGGKNPGKKARAKRVARRREEDRERSRLEAEKKREVKVAARQERRKLQRTVVQAVRHQQSKLMEDLRKAREEIVKLTAQLSKFLPTSVRAKRPPFDEKLLFNQLGRGGALSINEGHLKLVRENKILILVDKLYPGSRVTLRGVLGKFSGRQPKDYFDRLNMKDQKNYFANITNIFEKTDPGHEFWRDGDDIRGLLKSEYPENWPDSWEVFVNPVRLRIAHVVPPVLVSPDIGSQEVAGVASELAPVKSGLVLPPSVQQLMGGSAGSKSKRRAMRRSRRVDKSGSGGSRASQSGGSNTEGQEAKSPKDIFADKKARYLAGNGRLTLKVSSFLMKRRILVRVN